MVSTTLRPYIYRRRDTQCKKTPAADINASSQTNDESHTASSYLDPLVSFVVSQHQRDSNPAHKTLDQAVLPFILTH